MKHKLKLTLSTILLCLNVSILSVAAYSNRYNISGIVTDSLTGEPLAGVYVTTGRIGGQTDYHGRYSIKDIICGQDSITLTTMYYSLYSVANRRIKLESDTTINLALHQKKLNVDQVVITGTRTEKRLSDTPVLTSIIKDTEIQKSAAVSTLEALEDNIPGIVTDYNAMGSNLRIKGLNSRYILFLVDGERMVSEGAGGNINLDQIDVNNIKHIEMVSGASSALYGSNAMGAVINIITKEPHHKFEGGANISLQSYNTLKAQLNLGIRHKNIIFKVNGFRHSSDGFGGDGKGAYAAKYEDWGGSFRLGYNTSSNRLQTNITGRYFRHETFNPSGSMNTSRPYTHNLSLGGNIGYSSKDSRNDIKFSINFDKFLDMDYLEKLNSNKLRNTSSYLSTRIIDTFKPNQKWELMTGFEYNNEQNYSTTTLGAKPVTKQLDDLNIFAQSQYMPIQDLDIVFGARYTYNTQFGSAFTPKLSMMYKLHDFTFRGSAGTAFRAPSIKELYYDFDHQGMFWVYGNPDLKAEKGLYTSLSSEYTYAGLNLSISGYWNNINNKITQYDVVNEFGANEKHYTNVSSATLKGADFNISYVLFRDYVLKASYSYCDARDNSTGLQLESNVKHSGTISATWNGKIVRSPFSLQIAGRLSSARLYQKMTTNDKGENIVELNESNPYSIWKMVLVKPFRINKHTLEVTLKCDNIFNFKEESFVNPGRQYMIGLRYNFK